MASIAILAATLVSALPSTCVASQRRVGVRGASSDRRVSTQEVEGTLRDSLESVLRGSGEQRLARIEASVWETFQALPKNEMGRLDPRSVRHIVHGFFAKEHGWVINGLESRGLQTNASEVHEVDILQDRAPAFVEALLEARRAGRGLSLSDVVAMAGALERLIIEESFSLLQDAYTLNGQTVVDKIDAMTVHEVLSSYLLIFEVGTLGDVTDVRRHKAIKQVVAGTGESWDTVLQFEQDCVASYDFETNDRTNPFVPRQYSFAETTQMVENLAHDYGKWQNAKCRHMKEELADMDPDGSGRVPLKSFYSSPETADYQFKENVDYLRKIGAYDEATKSVRIVNYLMGPSNCVAKSTYYSVCCLSECDGLMNELERKIQAPATTPESLLGVISNLTSVEDARLPRDSSLVRLRDIANVNGGQVPLHGRLFAEFLHYAFPMDCPFPHVAEDDKVFSPTSWTSVQAAATEEERRMHLDSEVYPDAINRTEPVWSAEEVLPLVETTRRARSPLGVFVRLAAQLSALAAFAIAGLRTASAAGFCSGKDEGFALPVRV
jgi:hypothetical protein